PTDQMKLLVTFLLLAELALPQAVAPPSQPIPVDQENSRKAKTILDAAIQALGGQAYLNIHDITQEGRTFSFHHGQPNSFGVRFWRFSTKGRQSRKGNRLTRSPL